MSSWWEIVESFKPEARTRSAILAESDQVKRQPREDFDPLWGDPCPCGSSDWWKLPGPVLECQTCGCLVRSKYLASGGSD